jgi:hypothetical protein
VRAREPDVEAHVECEGVKIGYDVFGDGAPTVLLVPAWTTLRPDLSRLSAARRRWRRRRALPMLGACPPG